MWDKLTNDKYDGKYTATIKFGKLILDAGQGLDPKTINIPSNRLTDKPENSRWLVRIAQETEKTYFDYYKAISELTAFSDDSDEVLNGLFDSSKTSTTHSVITEPGAVKEPVTPKKSFSAYLDPLKLKILNYTLDMKSNAFLVGPKGCGKSTIARAIAEYRDCKFFEFDMSQAIKPKKFFVGGMTLEGDHTEFVRSEFFKAYTSAEPTVLFLDELTRIPDQASNFLMTMLSKGQSYIYDEDGGKRYYRGENVSIIAAGNFGAQYLGTSLLDSAFLDRFVKIAVDYPDEATEALLVQSKSKGCKISDIKTLVKAANILRKSNKEDGISQTMSTRTLIDCANFIGMGLTLNEAIKNIIIESYLDADDKSLATQLLASL